MEYTIIVATAKEHSKWVTDARKYPIDSGQYVAERFAAKVQEYVNKGWTPTGGLLEGQSAGLYAQAMIRG